MSTMPFGSLWLQVIVSAVAVFVVSSILHMALKYHRADIKKPANEDAIRDALAKAGLAPGVYMTPYCSDHSDLKLPEMQEKYKKGPVALITVLPSGLVNMGKHLGLWFGYCLFVSFTAAYVARHTLQPGVDHILVMRIVGAVSFCAYGLTNVIDSIWKGQPWSNTFRGLIDGFVYAVATAVVFGTMWPAA